MCSPLRATHFQCPSHCPCDLLCNYDVRVASCDIPKDLPFQVLLERNVLDLVELYALGKSEVVCIRNP